jgi:hypothetical protein
MTDRWLELKSIQCCICTLADALLAHGTLAGDDARRTYNKVWRGFRRPFDVS